MRCAHPAITDTRSDIPRSQRVANSRAVKVLAVLSAGAFAIALPLASAVAQPNRLPGNAALSCVTTEPFWRLTVATDGLWLSEFNGPWVELTAQASSAQGTLRSWMVSHPDGRSGYVTLAPGPGSDGMSERDYAYGLSVDLAGSKNEGGCDRLPNGARPVRVRESGDADSLAIRSSPAASSAALATVRAGEIVWLRRLRERSGWVPVATVIRNDAARAVVVTGWAERRFLPGSSATER